MTKYLLSTVLLAGVCTPASAQDAPASSEQIAGSHPECSFFGAQRERFLKATPTRSHVGQMTVQVAGMLPAAAASSSEAASSSLPSVPGGGRTFGRPAPNSSNNLIDKRIFAAFQQQG